MQSILRYLTEAGQQPFAVSDQTAPRSPRIHNRDGRDKRAVSDVSRSMQ